MTNPEDWLRGLRGGEVPPPSSIGALRRRIERRRRRGVVRGAALVLLLLVGAVVAWPNDDATKSIIVEGSAGSSTTTSTTGPLSVAFVSASEQGVVRYSPDSAETRISAMPAAAAYGIGSRLVVFQGAQAPSDVSPPDVDGPARVWSDGEVRDLPADPDASRVVLLDAGLVDGVPVALVAERHGTTPDDTFEDLVEINLRDDSRTTIVRRRAWESIHTAARLLADGDIIGLFDTDASVRLARWSSGSGEALWTVEAGIDTELDLTVRDGVISIIDFTFDIESDFTPVLKVTPYELTTGSRGQSNTYVIDDPEDGITTRPRCHDWFTPADLACARDGDSPIAVSPDAGSFTPVTGDPGAIPTVDRATDGKPTPLELPAQAACAEAQLGSTKELHAFFECSGARTTVPVGLGVAATGNIEIDARKAIEALGRSLTEEQVSAGFVAAVRVAPTDALVDSVDFADGTLSVDFAATARDILGGGMVGSGSVFLDRFLRTTFQFAQVVAVQATVEGDCLTFAIATGGDECATLDRGSIPFGQ